jgi:molybdopterin-guanine dinucleotide biosynthesis protein
VIDKPGSDSSRHVGAGADAVLLFGSHGAVVFLAADADDDAPHEGGLEQHGQHHRGGSPVDARRLARLGELVGRHLAHLDVVITEGFAPINDVLVAVQRESVPPKRPIDPDEVWFRVSDVPSDDSLGFDQIDEVAGRIVRRVASRRGDA